ncbi:protein FAM227B-like [Styela clava]
MYGASEKNDPLSDPRIAALMASVGNSLDDEVDNPPAKQESKHPAETFEEFLSEEKIDEWPQRLTSEGTLDLSEISTSSWSEEGILGTIKEKAPLDIHVLENIESQIEEFSKKLDAFAGYIVSNEELPSRMREKLFHAPKKEELEKAADSDAVALHHSRKKKKKDAKETMVEAMQASRSKNIDYATFPGFRLNELTELPSQLEAPQMLNKITEAQDFNRGFSQLWKKIFLSEASVALLQDSFWWFFLENFEHDPTAQDNLFTRIADSYVALFMSVNLDVRDKVLQVYPRCFSQCVYLTFREAFPESHDRLAEEFVTEVYGTISEWMSGVKPPLHEWKRWPWDKICSPPTIGKTETLPRTDVEKAHSARKAADYIRDLQSDMLAAIPPATADSSATSDGRQDITFSVPAEDGGKQTTFAESEKSPRQDKESAINIIKTARTTSVSPTIKTQNVKPYKEAESAQTGPGPDFERVMFNLGGRSPLVAHYLHMKQLRDKQIVGKQMKRTEIMQLPASAPTFQDVIRHSKKTVKDLHTQRDRMMAITEEERLRQEKLRKIIALDTKKAKDILSDPLEIKMRSDRVMDQAIGGGLHRPSSYGRIKSAHTDQDFYLQEDPLSDPEVVI